MSVSRTTIPDDERLDNVHPGDVLREDFLIGTGITIEEVSKGTGISAARLTALLGCEVDIDADLDLRLGRYFGMSEGFFLRLQNSYDLEEVLRGNGGAEIERIIPRAA